jgi:hypothetical protein
VERLTIISSDGEVCRTRRDISDGDAWHKLTEYEDTGLTPKEIKELKEFRDKNKGVEEYFETCVAKDKAIADRDYWKSEALKWCGKLGEIRLLAEGVNHERSKG